MALFAPALAIPNQLSADSGNITHWPGIKLHEAAVSLSGEEVVANSMALIGPIPGTLMRRAAGATIRPMRFAIHPASCVHVQARRVVKGYCRIPGNGLSA